MSSVSKPSILKENGNAQNMVNHSSSTFLKVDFIYQIQEHRNTPWLL